MDLRDNLVVQRVPGFQVTDYEPLILTRPGDVE